MGFVYRFTNQLYQIGVLMEQQIIKVIEKIRPYLQRDGGDIEFVRFEC